MKRFISICIILAMLCLSLAGCGDDDDTTVNEEINNILVAEHESMVSQLSSTNSYEDVRNYLLSWANDNQVNVSYDEYNNVIMSKKAVSDEYEDVPSTILHCSVDINDYEKAFNQMSVIMYILKYAESHGFVRAVFTVSENGDMLGAEKISKNYLKGDNLISLDWDQSNTLLTASAATEDYDMSHTIDWVPPAYEKAFEISIQGLPGGSTDNLEIKQPNPIRVIGDLLAAAKSKGILFELGGINGGISADTLPTACTAVVVLTQNDIARFTKRVESSQSNFTDKYAEQFGCTYTFKEIPLPEKVMSSDDCNNLVSFLYTMVNGTYLKADNGDTLANTNLGCISTNTGNLLVNVHAKSLNPSVLREISTVFDTICGLSGMTYALKDSFSGFGSVEYTADSPEDELNQGMDEEVPPEAAPEEIYLQEQLSAAMDEAFGNTPKQVSALSKTPCAIFSRRNSNIAVVGYGIDEKDLVIQAKALMNYLSYIPEK